MGAENKPSNVLLSIKANGVGVIELNRGPKRNALCQDMIDELTGVLHRFDQDEKVRVVVLSSTKDSPFSAGADLNELARISTAEAFRTGWLKDVEQAFSISRKPVIAAVRGFAFGGGFEIALMCDMIFAAQDSRFGFPEIKLGTIPGAGGTQRLAKAVGKHKAMELILTGIPTTATDMERFGVVVKTCPDEDVLDMALDVAGKIAAFSAPAVGLAKQAVKAAETTTLDAGLELERALYYSSFSLADCKEGIAAFLQKREPSFEHR